MKGLSKNEIEFEKELTELINRYSMENGSNTNDWILKDYLIGCLNNFNRAINNRERMIERTSGKEI